MRNVSLNAYNPLQASGQCTKKLLPERTKTDNIEVLRNVANASGWFSDVSEAYYYQNNQYHVALTKPFGLYKPLKSERNEEELTVKPHWYTVVNAGDVGDGEIYKRVTKRPGLPN